LLFFFFKEIMIHSVASTRGRQSGVVDHTVGYIFHGWLAQNVPIFVNRFQPDEPVT
jgi:hypothetical protein